VTIDEIRCWSVLSGVGCIVIGGSHGWVNTACLSFRTGGWTENRPKRICRKCREALPRLRREPST
jgi:hypothetical protein